MLVLAEENAAAPLQKKALVSRLGPFFVMAVREGFEPSNSLTRYTLSRRAPSATRTPHQNRFLCAF
jgi:hypothetical protein